MRNEEMLSNDCLQAVLGHILDFSAILVILYFSITFVSSFSTFYFISFVAVDTIGMIKWIDNKILIINLADMHIGRTKRLRTENCLKFKDRIIRQALKVWFFKSLADLSYYVKQRYKLILINVFVRKFAQHLFVSCWAHIAINLYLYTSATWYFIVNNRHKEKLIQQRSMAPRRRSSFINFNCY